MSTDPDLETVSSGKRERSKAANRDAILAAARLVFAEIGYEAATVRDIIRRTELASGTFYNYYKSKEEVFQALADDGARRFRPILRAVREQATSFESYLRLALLAYFKFRVEESMGLPPSQFGPSIRPFHTPELEAVYAEVREGIEDVIARGLAPKVDADYLACACIGIAQEVGDSMLARGAHEIERAVAFCTDFLLGGLERTAQAQSGA
jgi:AcrR family transcriptional regulator